MLVKQKGINMKKLSKKCAAFIASIIFSCSITPCFPYAYAEEISQSELQLDYAKNILPTYLESYDVDNDSIFISDSYGVYNIEYEYAGDDIYIVFEDNTIIGMLSVSNINGDFYSSFEYSTYETLQNLYEDGEEIAFIGDTQKLYVIDKSETFEIDNEVDNIDTSVNYNFVANSGVELERAYKVDIPQAVSRQVISFKRNLSVPIVRNTTVNGKGICWAAAIASKVNYLNNQNYLALDIFNSLASTYNAIPAGTKEWTERGYEFYNIPCTYKGSMMNCVEVYNNIVNDIPIHISLTDDEVGHAVILSGITINTDGSGVYQLVDSNRSVPIDVSVSADTMTADANFVYATSYGITFTSWYRSFY